MSAARHPRVLVLDDDPAILSLLAERLSELSIHLVECSELEAAESLIDHMQFSVLIVDLEVSELGGLEGMRLIRHAVANFSETRVIIFSGNVSPYAVKLAGALGVTEVLEKPAGLDRLVRLVRSLTTDPFATDAPADSGKLAVVEPLEQVIAQKQISSVFQPILSLAGGTSRLFGFEALARGPQGSLLRNPQILFDYAVRKEMAFETDVLCIETALVSAKGILGDARLFINTHPRALSHADYVAALDDLFERHRVPRQQVVLELTEQSAIVDPPALAEILAALRERGAQIALDDYGEGSSNLHLILDLRPEFLKISGRFCISIESEPAKQALVRASVDLSRSLGIRTVMERVESDRELATVRALRIDYGQGYHLGRPRRAQEIKGWRSDGPGDRGLRDC